MKWGLYLLYEVTRGIRQEKNPNTKRQILYDSIYTMYLEEIHCDKKQYNGSQTLGERKQGELLFNGYRVSVWGDEKVLAIGSDGCTIM